MAFRHTFCALLSVACITFAFSVNVDCGSGSDNFPRLSLEDARLIGHTDVGSTPVNESTPLINGVYETYRYSASNESEWGYDVFVPPGNYSLTLQFAETDPDAFAVGKRRFDVEVEGELRDRALDVFREAGNRSYTPVERSYSVRVKRNVLSFRLIDRVSDSKLCAFQVAPMDEEELALPYRLNVGSDFQADKFLSDSNRFIVSGGDILVKFGTPHRIVFQTARIGNVSYVFPVKRDRKYDVTLHCVEIDEEYYKEGARVFGITANNVSVHDIDVYKEAGTKAMTYTFKSVPAPNGKILIVLNEQTGDPIVNAITIDREGSHMPSGKSFVVSAVNLGGEAVQGYEADNSTLVTSTPKSYYVPASWIDGASAPELYRSFRVQSNDSGIELSIPVGDVKNETYSIDLLFAEMELTTSGARVMDIYINEMRRQTIDIFDMFGAGVANNVRFSRLRPNVNGTLDVRVVGTTGNATLSGFILRKDLNDGPASTWKSVLAQDDSMALARHENCAVEFEGDLYLIGGRRLQYVTKFDTLSRNWTMMEAPPVEVHHMQCAVVGDRVVVGMAFTGGYPREQTIDRLMWFHPRNNSWTWGATIPEDRNRGSAATIVRNDTVYFINGNVGGHGAHATSVNWFDAYHVHNDSWMVLPDTPVARDHGMASIAGDSIVVIGGRNGGTAAFFDATVNQVDVWRFDDGYWATAAEVWAQPSGGALLGSFDERYVVVAGGEGFDRIWPRTSMFDAIDMRFIDLGESDMVTARHGTQLMRCGNALYAACGSGWQGGEPELISVEAFTLDGSEPLPCKSLSY